MTTILLLLGAVLMIFAATQVKGGCSYLTIEYSIEGDESNVSFVLKQTEHEIYAATYDGAGWMRAVVSISVLDEKVLIAACNDLKLECKKLEPVW